MRKQNNVVTKTLKEFEGFEKQFVESGREKPSREPFEFWKEGYYYKDMEVNLDFRDFRKALGKGGV